MNESLRRLLRDFNNTPASYVSSLLLSIIHLQISTAVAATRTWDGGGGNNNWSNAANWNAAVAAGDDLVFPGNSVDATSLNNTNDFPANTPFRSITFTGTNYSLRGNSIIFTNTGVVAMRGQHGGGTNTVSLAMRLDADQTFQMDQSGATLAITGDINLNGRNLTNNAAGLAIPYGVIRLGGVINGSGNIIKLGIGIVVLEGSTANSYVGATIVKAGILQLNKAANNSSIPGALFIGDDFGGTSDDVVRLATNDQLADTAVVTVTSSGLLDLNGFSEMIGLLTLAGGRIQTAGGTLTLGNDVLVQGSTNSESMISGRVLLPASRTLQFSNSFHAYDLNIQASIIGEGGLTLAGNGGAILTSSNSFLGPTLVTDMCGLALSNSFALGSTNAGTTVSGLAHLILLGGSGVGNEPLSLNSTRTLGALLSGEGSTNSWSGPITLVVTAGVNVGTRLILSNSIGGPGGLVKVGAGTLEFTSPSANTYAGTTTVNQGTLFLNKSIPNASIPGDLIVGDGAGGADSDIVQIVGVLSQINDFPAVTINSSGLLLLPPATFLFETIGSLSGVGHVRSAGANLAVGANHDSTTFAGLITGNGQFIKEGSGTLTLEGNNTYTGQTTINAGKLLVNGSQPQSTMRVIGGTLGGAGMVGHISEFVGNVAPGVSPGLLSCSNLTVSGSGVTPGDVTVELNGTIPGAGFDQLKVNGLVTFSLARLNATLGFPSAISNSFTIIDNDGTDVVGGAFSGLPEGTTLNVSGTPFRVSYGGGTGNDVTLTQLTDTQHPRLNVRHASSNSMVLSWPTNFTGYTLASSTNLNSNLWCMVSPTPAVSGTNNVVTNSLLGLQNYYRLQTP